MSRYRGIVADLACDVRYEDSSEVKDGGGLFLLLEPDGHWVLNEFNCGIHHSRVLTQEIVI